MKIQILRRPPTVEEKIDHPPGFPETPEYLHETFSDKYSPPCWVNDKLQRKLSNTVYFSMLELSQLGRELWEASGGQEIGYEEFKKFATKSRCVNISAAQIHCIWRSYFPPDVEHSRILSSSGTYEYRKSRVPKPSAPIKKYGSLPDLSCKDTPSSSGDKICIDCDKPIDIHFVRKRCMKCIEGYVHIQFLVNSMVEYVLV